MTDQPSLPDLVIFAGMLVGFYGIARFMLKQATKDRNADRSERLELSKAIVMMAKSSDKVATATERSADEAKQRNGHLADLIEQSNQKTELLANTAVGTIIAAVQNVHEQKVEHQTVKKSEVNK